MIRERQLIFLYVFGDSYFIKKTHVRFLLADELIHGINISKSKYVFVSKQVYKIHYETLKSMDVIEKIILYDDVPKSNDCLRYRDLTEKYVDITTYKAVKYNGK